MVGKVVGKRRKRPLPESKFNEISHWNVMRGQTALPSPSPTVFSEPQSKRASLAHEPSFFIQIDEQANLDFATCHEPQFFDLDMCQAEPNASTEVPFMLGNGLPTPSMSPLDMKYQAPIEMSRRPSAVMSHVQYSPRSNISTSSSQHPDDDETTCIKLLAHLKRQSRHDHQSYQDLISLVSNTNSVVQRLLRSSTIKSDYSCHLLLTSIMTHMASTCEQLLNHYEVGHEHEFLNEAAFGEENSSDSRMGGAMQTFAKNATCEAVSNCVGIGSLLKRKPLNGFQVLGRQESALIDCEKRLRAVYIAL